MGDMFFSGKNIVLGVAAGIAAYKSVDLLRKLVKLGANVQVVMSKNATKFIGTATFEALSHNSVLIDLFQNKNGGEIPHTNLAESADVVVLAPATANIISKMANGIADDALSTFLLVATCPVMVCPSMNSDMYEHPATKRNLDFLNQDGCFILLPGNGKLACGISGPGRLPDPSRIIDRLISYMTQNDFASTRFLITAGPTREYIDPVRFLSNPSSGKMGYAVARAAESRGAEVTLISGPVFIDPPENINLIRVQSAREMAAAVLENLGRIDVVVKTAAVSDHRPERFIPYKIKKNFEFRTLKLAKNVDILTEIGQNKVEGQIVVGFAAETCDIEINSKKKLKEKKLDMIVSNLVGMSNSGFSSDTNEVTFFFADGKIENIDTMLKDSLAHVLLDRIYELVKSKK